MATKPTPTVQRTYRFRPELARRLADAARKLGITQNALIAGAAQHALDERRRTPKARAKVEARA